MYDTYGSIISNVDNSNKITKDEQEKKLFFWRSSFFGLLLFSGVLLTIFYLNNGGNGSGFLKERQEDVEKDMDSDSS